MRLDQLVDPPPVTATAAGRRLAVREHDLVDVQEPVALEADVDERRLHAGEHVVDDALVDVADDRPLAAALDVELGDLAVAVGAPAPLRGRGRRGLLRLRLPPLRCALAFEHRDAGLARVD